MNFAPNTWDSQPSFYCNWTSSFNCLSMSMWWLSSPIDLSGRVNLTSTSSLHIPQIFWVHIFNDCILLKTNYNTRQSKMKLTFLFKEKGSINRFENIKQLFISKHKNIYQLKNLQDLKCTRFNDHLLRFHVVWQHIKTA